MTTKRPGWAAARRACLARDKQCMKCRATTGLEAHHMKERCQGGGDELANLVTLCSLCHDEWTIMPSPAALLSFEDWLLVPPARFLVGVFAKPWPENMSAADFKWLVLQMIDSLRDETR